MKLTEVSAVVPVYNSEKYLEEAIYSLINQTYRLKEIIIVDNGSNDNSVKIIRSISEKSKISIKLYELGCNYGASFSRNYGLNNCNGDMILLLDSDDVLENSLVEKQLNRIIEYEKFNDECSIVYSAYSQIDPNGNKLQGIIKGIELSREEALGYEFVRNLIITSSGVMLKKKSVLALNGFNTNLDFSEDWDLWLRLCFNSGIAYVDEPLIYVRRHANNTSSQITNMLQGEKKVFLQYDISVIKNAIFKRKLTYEDNISDYISVLYKLDKWEDAYREFSNLSDFIYNYKISFLKGLYFLHKEKYDLAEKYFYDTVCLNSNHGAALNNLACINALKGKMVLAEQYLNNALKIYSNYLDASKNLYILHTKSKFYSRDFNFTWRELRNVLLNYNDIIESKN